MIGESKSTLSDSQPSGKRPGHYEILRVVNRGGMGEIALGRVRGTKGFEKLVVLKRLRADAEREDHVEMFDVEQEVMSRIEHPNIVKVFDQPVIENTQYLAMEYVRGRNLDQVIRQANLTGQTLSLRFSLSVIAEVLRGLAFVHRLKDGDGNALGVVHQDMTPSNVMVSFFGEVKITDFGISYVTSRDGGLRKGVLKGKPRYVAPEVLAGKRVNNQADIYGVAVVFYEMLTGKALFARTSVKETLAAVARNELPDFAEEFPKSGAGVWKLFERALKKDPQDRYRTAEEMAAEVFSELTQLGGTLSPATMGYQLRNFFKDDPDVPELDPAFEDALLKSEAAPSARPSEKPAGLNLDQTLEQLDRLLGPESVDLFTLPPELEKELSDIQDSDPFQAKTPLPDFVWDVRSDAEILKRANPELLREMPSLFEQEPPRLPPPLDPKDVAAIAEFTPPRGTRRGTSGQYSMTKPAFEEEPPKPALEAQKPVELAKPDEASMKLPAEPVRDRFWLGIMIGLCFGLAIAIGWRFLAG
jgi:serine/threonine protein kinase